MAEADADGASAAAVAGSGADGSGESPAVEGGGAGALSEEKEAAAKGAEAAGDSEEDGEDVFEVEKILDMKTEGVRAGRPTRGGRRGGGAGGGAGAFLAAGDVSRRRGRGDCAPLLGLRPRLLPAGHISGPEALSILVPLPGNSCSLPPGKPRLTLIPTE